MFNLAHFLNIANVNGLFITKGISLATTHYTFLIELIFYSFNLGNDIIQKIQ